MSVSLLVATALCGVVAWSAEPIALAPEEGLLILQNGEVIRGKITQSGNRYYVALPHGELRLRAEEVALRCKDLQEGYEKKRSALRGTRAEEHLELAQWCLHHELFDAAEAEVRQASLLDTDHPRIRLMTRRLELARSAPKMPSAIAIAPPPTNDHAELDRLTKHVPAAVMQKFTVSIQPLLVNSCATTGCHGIGAKSEFTLTKVRGQGDRARRQTQRNLLAVLEQLDLRRPQESPLLVQPIAPHGGRTTPIFSRQNSRQYYELYEWARSATGGNRATGVASRNGNAGATAPSGESDEPLTDDVVEQVDFASEVETDAEPAPEADPFDPDEFNEQFGSTE